MNQIELYHDVFLISSALAGIFFLASMVMFFAFDMRRMIGRNAPKRKNKPAKSFKQFQGRNGKKKNRNQNTVFTSPQTKTRGDNITTKLREKEVVREALDIHVNQKKAAGLVVVSEIMEVHSDKLIDGF